MNITGKSILVTGANRGIGLALVNEALNRGAKRVYAAVRGTYQYADPRVTILKVDVTSASQIQQAAREVGVLDVLINNAGVALPIADGWRNGVVKAMEHQFAGFVPASIAKVA